MAQVFGEKSSVRLPRPSCSTYRTPLCTVNHALIIYKVHVSSFSRQHGGLLLSSSWIPGPLKIGAHREREREILVSPLRHRPCVVKPGSTLLATPCASWVLPSSVFSHWYFVAARGRSTTASLQRWFLRRGEDVACLVRQPASRGKVEMTWGGLRRIAVASGLTRRCHEDPKNWKGRPWFSRLPVSGCGFTRASVATSTELPQSRTAASWPQTKPSPPRYRRASDRLRFPVPSSPRTLFLESCAASALFEQICGREAGTCPTGPVTA